MGGGLESRCLGRVYGADGAVQLHTNTLGKLALGQIFLCVLRLPLAVYK